MRKPDQIKEARERVNYIVQRLGEGSFTDLLRYYPQATPHDRLNAFAFDFRALIKHLDAQAALIAEAGGVVEPFVEAAANLGSYDHDRDYLWESPEAAMLTVGDLRHIAALSDKLKAGGAGCE